LTISNLYHVLSGLAECGRRPQSSGIGRKGQGMKLRSARGGIEGMKHSVGGDTLFAMQDGLTPRPLLMEGTFQVGVVEMGSAMKLAIDWTILLPLSPRPNGFSVLWT
jgi:hypothetical protein